VQPGASRPRVEPRPPHPTKPQKNPGALYRNPGSFWGSLQALSGESWRACWCGYRCVGRSAGPKSGSNCWQPPDTLAKRGPISSCYPYPELVEPTEKGLGRKSVRRCYLPFFGARVSRWTGIASEWRRLQDCRFQGPHAASLDRTQKLLEWADRTPATAEPCVTPASPAAQSGGKHFKFED
jgi:hypothetical protein